MRTLGLIAIVSSLAIVGCKSKQENKPGTGSGGSGSASTAGGASSATGTTSATTEASGDLNAVTACPPALKDTDRGLARTIPAGCTTVVEGEYTVEGTLTIEAGATLRFKPDAVLYVGYSTPSKLVVRGTKDKPVTFASAGDQVPGAWRGVHLYQKAARSEIVGLVLEYATTGIEIDSIDVTIKDSTFRGTKELAVRVADDVTVAAIAGNTFDKTGALAMSVPPAAMIAIDKNTFPADSVIQVRAGKAATSGTWKNPGAPVRVSGEIYVDGSSGKARIEVAAGSTFQVESGGAIYVGYSTEGELVISGTAEAPVAFRSAGDQTPGAWQHGITVYSHGSLTATGAVFEHGGREAAGVVRAEGGGKLSITSSSFTSNTVGVSLDEPSELRAFAQNTFTGNKDAALILQPNHVGVLGTDNKYTEQRILIHGGRVDKAVTWAVQPGAQVVVDGEVYVEAGGVLTLPAGARYELTDAGQVYVGYAGPGTLIAKGTTAAPISFVGARDEEGAWKGIELSSRSLNSVFENVSIANATVGINVLGPSVATINGLTCTKCKEAALRWDCSAKVTQTGVKVSGGAAKAMLSPEGC